MSNFGKISLRTNMMFHGGFPFDTGHGFAIPVTAGGGRQVGIIIKRINDRIEVRMVSGYQLDTELGIRPSWDYSGGGADVGISLEGSLWNTSGIAWHFDITYNEKTGREDFSKTQSFLRSLFTGELPSTEAVAQRISNFQRISKSPR